MQGLAHWRTPDRTPELFKHGALHRTLTTGSEISGTDRQSESSSGAAAESRDLVLVPYTGVPGPTVMIQRERDRCLTLASAPVALSCVPRTFSIWLFNNSKC